MSAPPHIFTLTGNLLAEHTLEFEAWTPGRTQRARRETFQVGGKGINVSKMLRRLGVAHTALAFTGGATGRACEEWLRAQGFACRLFATATPTRRGIVVRDHSGAHPETTFLGSDSPPDAAALQVCAAFLEAQPDGQVLALCGSFPGWASPDAAPLRAALHRWARRGALVADTYGPPLADLVAAPLALLKINADEARTLPAGNSAALPTSLQRWIVTDGPRAVRLRDGANAEETLLPPVVREVSPTGSGDVLLAAVLESIFIRGRPLREAVDAALPLAAANAAHPGIADFPLSL
ncbi:MAG: PfkB family carbohydrate kinase [Opitutaceae bacterium]|nr:PfkB family carbohydrate kinase [Opitutaceae bacterium]